MTTSFFFKSVEKWEKFWILLRITLGIILFSSQSGKRSLLNFLYIYIRSVIWQTLRKKNHGEPVTRPWYRPTDLTPVRNKFIGYVQDGKTGVAYEKDVYIAIFIVPALFFVFFFYRIALRGKDVHLTLINFISIICKLRNTIALP